MKKALLFIFLCCFSFLYAEGYRGVKWHSSIDEVQSIRAISIYDIALPNTGTLVEKTHMLGEETELFYGFWENQLNNIFYFSDIKNKDLLLEKISNSKNYTKESYYRNPIEGYADINKIDLKSKRPETWLYCFTLAFYEQHGVEFEDSNIENETSIISELYVFNYNDDSYMVIFANIFKDKLLVSYFPKQQDF